MKCKGKIKYKGKISKGAFAKRSGHVSEGAFLKHKAYISDEKVIKRANAAVRIELEKNKALGIPSVIYDRESQIIYRENGDGTRIEVGRKMRRGRYSEQISKKA